MSKSLGTGIDPLALIDGGPRPPVFTEGGDFPAYGADAVRYGLLAMSSTQDVRFNEGTIAEGRQLANKLFNASRLVLLRVPEGVSVPAAVPEATTVEDTWILSRLQAAEAEVADAIADFEFHRATRTLYRFVYAELCDWYLEMLKPRLYEDDNAETAAFALYVLAQTLKLAHPVIPFVTEELWALMPGTGDLLMSERWPEADPALRDEETEREVSRAIEATQALRKWRDGVKAPPGARVPARLEADGYERVAEHVARLSRFEFSLNGDHPVATVGVPGGNVAVLASDQVDLEAEKKRAAERAQVLQAEIKRAEGKLANPGFVAKAPEAVVQAEREKLEKLKRELEELS
jgi:valyl-tRNA synthetase